MMKKTTIAAFLIFINLSFGQDHNIVQKINIPTYDFNDPNPLPSFIVNPKIYPYHKFDGYTSIKSSKEFTVIQLENDFISVEILPEIGGKVWGATDKSNGNEFIYKNKEIKFRNIAMRGPWTSGGIEFNFGIIGHHPGTATPVDYAVETLEDGTKICTVGTIDLPSRTQWRVQIELKPGESSFATHATWYNPNPTEKAYYNWMTAAARATEDLSFIVPGSNYLEHGGASKSWPIDSFNRTLSNYAENNFGLSKSYHVVGEYNDFFGGYYANSDVGFGHWGNYEDIPGQKIWVWDLSRFGGIWEDLLTDTSGQYIEYQAGRLFVQYSPGEENPISQVTFDPFRTDQWTEVWFPLKDTKGLAKASPLGALNVLNKSGSLELRVNSFIKNEALVRVHQGGHKYESSLSVEPNKSYILLFEEIKFNEPFQVSIEELELSYNSTPELIKRPFETNSSLKGYNSTSKLFNEALQAQRFRVYDKAENDLRKVISEDAAHLDAITALGMLLYDKGNYSEALEVINKGLSIDTYHPGLNYAAGINYLEISDWLNAKESLGWAAHSNAYRSGSNGIMSRISLLKKNPKEALYYANKSLAANTKNIQSLIYKYSSLIELNKKLEAEVVLKELKQIDPLHHFISAEAYFNHKITANELKEHYHRSEFAYQTFLELALLYYQIGFEDKAVEILELSPKNMLIDLWISYIKNDAALIDDILKSPIDFIFPFRTESLKMLNWVVSKNDHWKGQYLLALNLMGVHQKESGLQKMIDLKTTPKSALFYWIRANLLEQSNSVASRQDYKTAYLKDSNNWRFAIDYAAVLEAMNQPNEALKILNKSYASHPEKYELGVRIVKVLNTLGEFEKAIKLLKSLQILPYEHAMDGRKLYTTSYIGAATNALTLQKWDYAKELLEESLEWPEHLGVGKPFDAEERLSLFLKAYALNQKGDSYQNELQKISKYSKTHLNRGGKNCLLGLYAIKLLEGDLAVQTYAQQLKKSESNSSIIDAVLKFYYNNPLEDLSNLKMDSLLLFMQE